MASQEIVVEVGSDPASLIVSGMAVLIALASLAWSFFQGRAIRNIETREHDWQAADRISANVEVTIRKRRPVFGPDYLVARLRNTGRAAARNVSWAFDDTQEAPHDVDERTVGRQVVVPGQNDYLRVLYPGEWFYVQLPSPNVGQPRIASFLVSWEDGNGPHHTRRAINLV